MNELVLSLLLFASQQTGYSIPTDIQPQVIYASHSYFVNNFCDGADTAFQPCFFVGMYIPDKNEIYIDITREASEEKNAFIVHELTHFLQHAHSVHQGFSCDEAIIRETEAYKTENAYRALHDLHPNRVPDKDSSGIICDHEKASAIDNTPDSTQGEGPWLPVPDPFPYIQGEGPS